jgi:hypothetical protein
MNGQSAAFVLITTERGKEKYVLKRLTCLEGVTAHEVQSPYDICAKFTDSNTDILKEKIGKIKESIPEIRSHLSLHIIEGYAKEGGEMKKTPYSII